jgi:hypothetical protein
VRALLAAALPHTGALRGALGAYLFPQTRPGAFHVLPALTATALPSLIVVKKGLHPRPLPISLSRTRLRPRHLHNFDYVDRRSGHLQERLILPEYSRGFVR